MKSVLVADDDRATVALLEGLLRAEGWRVETALDGAAALDRAQKMVPDVVITDREMPGLTGNQLAASIRASERLKRTYIIVLTAHGAKPDKMKALLSGADDFLVKPAQPAEIVGRTEIALRVLKAEREAAEAKRRAEAPPPGSTAALGASLAVVRGQLAAAERSTDPQETRARCREALAGVDAALRGLGG